MSSKLILPAHTYTEIPSKTPASDAQSSSVTKSKKLYIWLENGKILPFELASDIIYNSFKVSLEEKGYNWKDVTEVTKNIYFNEFKKYTYWDEGYEDAIHKAWRPTTGRYFADFVYKQSTQPQQEYMSINVWAAWHVYWATEAFIAISTKASKNRPSGNGGLSKYLGGSIRFHTHWEKEKDQYKMCILYTTRRRARTITLPRRPKNWKEVREVIDSCGAKPNNREGSQEKNIHRYCQAFEEE